MSFLCIHGQGKIEIIHMSRNQGRKDGMEKMRPVVVNSLDHLRGKIFVFPFLGETLEWTTEIQKDLSTFLLHRTLTQRPYVTTI